MDSYITIYACFSFYICSYTREKGKKRKRKEDKRLLLRVQWSRFQSFFNGKIKEWSHPITLLVLLPVSTKQYFGFSSSQKENIFKQMVNFILYITNHSPGNFFGVMSLFLLHHLPYTFFPKPQLFGTFYL